MTRTTRLQTAVLTAAALWPAAAAVAQLKAFPEAEGFGRYASGARTNLASASVYHVTHLNDSGAGSFRDAVSQPNRFIVFDVAGAIDISSPVSVSSNVTIAGQTAPGGGITIYGNRLSFTNANNSIMRFIRVRKGYEGAQEDAMTIVSGNNLMFDHVSVTWGTDETFSMSGSAISNVTVQNSIIGQGLHRYNHSAGALVETSGGVSLLRNLWIDNWMRNPKVKGVNQFVNNIVYNWDDSGYILGDSAGLSYANVERNYFINGPSGTGPAFTRGNENFHIYASENFHDSNRNGTLDGAALAQGDYGVVSWETQPFDYPAIVPLSAQQAYDYVIAKAGPSVYRDEVDTRMFTELQSLGTLGQFVVNELDLYPNFPASLPGGTPIVDTDQDGIPNDWEMSHGLNPNDGADWKTLNLAGYTKLEEYLNELGGMHGEKTWTAAAGTWPTGGNWAGGVPTWDDNAYVYGNGPGTSGTVSVTAAGAEAFRLFIGGNSSGGAGEAVTVNGGSLRVVDTLAVGHLNHGSLTIDTGEVNAGSILIGNGSFNGQVTVGANGTLKAGVISHAGGGSFIINGGTVAAHANATYSAPAHIGAAGARLHSDTFTANFTGNISGPGGITKSGDGTFNLSGNNTFAGGVTLNGGALGITSDSNIGGAASPITFAGGLLRINGTTLSNIDTHAVNWSTFNGGFDIAGSSHTFTVNSMIGGSGSLTKSGPGTLVLTSANSYAGGTVLRGGALAISNLNNIGGAGRSLSFEGGILRVLGATISNLNDAIVNWNTFDGGFDIVSAGHTFTIDQVIGGAGGLIKNGPGTLLLNAPNTFTGDTVINAGVLRVGHPEALRFSTVNFPTGGGGQLDLGGFSLSFGAIAGNGNVDLQGGTLTTGFNNLDSTFSGVISDSVGGGKITKVGDGVLTLSGNSTFTGQLIVTDGAIGYSGNVSASGASPFGAGVGGLVLDGGTLMRTGTGSGTVSRPFTLGSAGGTLEGNTASTAINSAAGILHIGAGDRTLFLAGQNQDNSINIPLSDPAGAKLSLHKVGTGRWIMSGSPVWTYSGDTILSAGTLIMNGGNNTLPFGTGKGNLVIESGARFDMNGRDLTINGLDGAGNINQRQGSTRTINLGNGNASGNFSGSITNSGSASAVVNLIKNGSGLQVLSGNNTFTGTTTINTGILQYNAQNSMGSGTANVTIAAKAAAAAGFAMNQAFLGRINPASTGVVALAANSSNPLNFTGLNVSLGAVGSATFGGSLTPNANLYRLGGGGGTLAIANTNLLNGSRDLFISGGGTVILLGANALSGFTSVSSTGLIIGHPTAIGSATLSISGGTVELAANLSAAVKTSALSVATDARLELHDNGFIVDYTGTSPIGAIRGSIVAGDIVSSLSLTDPRVAVGYAEAIEIGVGSFGGVLVDDTAVLIRPALRGDANLDENVDIGDFARLAAFFNAAGDWSDGDFDRSNTIDIADFAHLAANFNQSLPAIAPRQAAPATVPEPFAAGFLALEAMFVRRVRPAAV